MMVLLVIGAVWTAVAVVAAPIVGLLLRSRWSEDYTIVPPERHHDDVVEPDEFDVALSA